MLVRQILNTKKSGEIVSIAPDATVAEAARLLTEKRIGALIVLGEGNGEGDRIEGMFSERDIVRGLARNGAGCLDETVADLMTHRITTCAPGDRADDVLRKMTEGRFRHCPVIEDGRLIGIISIGDVVFARLAEVSMEKEALEGMIKGF